LLDIDFVFFFWDPLEPHPHDVDVKALLRVAVVYNVPIACNAPQPISCSPRRSSTRTTIG
jgi:methylglyoxal synthase